MLKSSRESLEKRATHNTLRFTCLVNWIRVLNPLACVQLFCSTFRRERESKRRKRHNGAIIERERTLRRSILLSEDLNCHVSFLRLAGEAMRLRHFFYDVTRVRKEENDATNFTFVSSIVNTNNEAYLNVVHKMYLTSVFVLSRTSADPVISKEVDSRTGEFIRRKF